jgi:hypothetical protein
MAYNYSRSKLNEIIENSQKNKSKPFYKWISTYITLFMVLAISGPFLAGEFDNIDPNPVFMYIVMIATFISVGIGMRLLSVKSSNFMIREMTQELDRLNNELNQEKQKELNDKRIKESVSKSIPDYQLKIEEKLSSFKTEFPKFYSKIKLASPFDINDERNIQQLIAHTWQDDEKVYFIVTPSEISRFDKNFLLNYRGVILKNTSGRNILDGIYNSLSYIFKKDIIYYTVEGNQSHEQKISGGGGTIGGVSIAGAAVGGILFGPIGMIIGSRKKTEIQEIKSETITKDNRKLVLYYSRNSKTEKIEFSADSYADFKRILPEYDLSVVNSGSARKDDNSEKKLNEKNTNNKIEKIKELQDLLQQELITLEEFNKLKKEII